MEITTKDNKIDLVSIISPTYNGAEYLPYFLNSILAQDYNNIQLVMVDDGSTDNTYSILCSYLDKFEIRGYELKIISQSNQGQAAAINAGLRHFTGTYMMWMDSDDMLKPDCISKMITWLHNHQDKDFVLCDAQYVSYPDFIPQFKKSRVIKKKTDPYFYDILNGKHNYTLGSGTLLIRRESFTKAIPSMEIFESREGQNYQLMLPLVYFCHWGYLHEPLFLRVMRADSHSHKERSYEEELSRRQNFLFLMKETIRSMQISEQKKAFRLVENRFAHECFLLAWQHDDIFVMRKQLIVLLRNFAANPRELLKYLKCRIKNTTVIS